MTQESYNKATELKRSQGLLAKVGRVMSFPYPTFFFKPKFDLTYLRENLEVNFWELDEKTREELRAAIYDVINKRAMEIDEELAQL